MSITVLTPCFPRFNGDFHGVFVKELCDNLSKEVDLNVLAPRTKTLDTLSTHYSVERFPYLPKQWMENLPEATMKGVSITRLLELPFYMLGAQRALNKQSPSLVHSHLAIPLGILGALNQKPSVLTCHGSDLTLPLKEKRYLPFTKLALQKTSKVIPVSKYLEQIALKLGASPEKTRTIYLGVDPDRFTPRQTRHLTIGTLGRLVPQKNIEDFLHAACNLEKKYDFTLRIGGEGASRGYLETIASKLDLKVEFTGAILDPVAFHQSLDIFVLCSTSEGLSISLQEAMSCGVTPVAVNTCGCPELITNRLNGYMYEPRNIQDLTSKLEEAIHTRLGDKARRTIKHRFNSKENSKQYLEIYQELGHRF